MNVIPRIPRNTTHILTAAELAAAKDLYWQTGGTADQIQDIIYDHIHANRDVTPKGEIRPGTGVEEYYIHVIYSALEDDYRNNLNEIAIEGRVQFKTPYSEFFGGKSEEARTDYESEILENPTWLELSLLANDMINCTGDQHHVFLEDVHKTDIFTLDDKSFVLIYNFSMGS